MTPESAPDPAAPRTLRDLVLEVRDRLVCDRCLKYIGSLAATRYLPAPYPVALGRIGPDDEAAALVGFELHMASLVSDGKFALRHPQSKGRCVSVREWLADSLGEDDEADGEEYDEPA